MAHICLPTDVKKFDTAEMQQGRASQGQPSTIENQVKLHCQCDEAVRWVLVHPQDAPCGPSVSHPS